MRKIISLKSYSFSVMFLLALVATGFFIAFKPVSAANGDIIITVQNELGASVLGTSFTLSCTGGTDLSITDGGAGDSDSTNNGTINVLAASVDDEASNCANGEAFTADIIVLNGYVTENTSLTTYTTGAQNTATTTLDFSHKFITKDELNNNLTLTSATAGSGNTPCTISTNNVYCPILVAGDDTLSSGMIGTKDGYVTTVASDVPLASNRAANTDPQAVTTMTGTNGLKFGHKVLVVDELGSALAPNSATSAAGGSTLCTANGTNVYCPILLADDNTLSNGFIINKSGYVTTSAAAVPLAGSRTVGSDPQQVVTMTTSNGLKFGHKAIVVDELGNNLTPTSATAGSAATNCTIVTNNVYCAVPTNEDDTSSDGFVIGRDGYVTTSAAAVPLAGDRTTGTSAQQVTTLSTTNGLNYAVKITATKSAGGGALSGATVVAGNGYTTSCAESGSTGIYFCAVPLADTEVSARVVKTDFITGFSTYTDRTGATDAQSTVAMSLEAGAVSSGGGGGGGVSGGASGFATTNTTNSNTSTSNQTPPAEATPDQPIPKPKDIITRIDEEKDLIFSQANSESYFVTIGTETTIKLGSGERAAAVSSFKEAYGAGPKTAAEWKDVLNIANGRWPITVNKSVEARAYINFRAAYGRNADMKNSTDVNALKMMGYGVRSTKARDLKAEASAIVKFRTTFGMAPTTARHWNIVRAFAYSGLTK